MHIYMYVPYIMVKDCIALAIKYPLRLLGQALRFESTISAR